MLREMTEEEFQQHVQAAVTRMTEQPKNLNAEAGQAWGSILSQTLRFHARFVEAECLTSLSQQVRYRPRRRHCCCCCRAACSPARGLPLCGAGRCGLLRRPGGPRRRKPTRSGVQGGSQQATRRPAHSGAGGAGGRAGGGFGRRVQAPQSAVAQPDGPAVGEVVMWASPTCSEPLAPPSLAHAGTCVDIVQSTSSRRRAAGGQ